MKKYWLIAPWEWDASEPSEWKQIWDYDLRAGLISIGYGELGDVRKIGEHELEQKIKEHWPKGAVGYIRNIFKNFYRGMGIGDVVICRRGKRRIESIGTISGQAFFDPARAKATGIPEFEHPNFLPVQWDKDFKPIDFPEDVFNTQCFREVLEEDYKKWIQSVYTKPAEDGGTTVPPAPSPTKEDNSSFVLEKHLEDFIVSNFLKVFHGKLVIYEDKNEELNGQQFITEIGRIDILAITDDGKNFVVIELKRELSSDVVIGQTLRYMGWVKKNLCGSDQGVRGIIITKDTDDRLEYAIQMVQNIEVRKYSITFELK